MNTARMVRTDDSWRVTFPFDRDVVESIKQLVPPHSRTYEPDERAWYVTPRYGDLIRKLLQSAFVDVEIDEDETYYSPPPPPTSSAPQTSYHVLYLQPAVPPELVESAYRTLARLHHPDAGGSTETMQRLNDAVSSIRRRLA